MKKSLWSLIGLMVIGVAVFMLITGSVSNKKTVDKRVSFAVYKGNNYTSRVYNEAYAKLHVSIEIVRRNNRTTVWEKTYDAKLLKQYPDFKHSFTQQVTIHDLVEKKEHLEVAYTRIYNWRDSELEIQNATIVSDSCNDKLNISI